jgi:8-oxo-dGTP diphosphatase
MHYVGVGVGVVNTKDDLVLLLKRKSVHGEGTWSPPGGHLEFGETPEECAIREAYEETAVNIDSLAFRGITNDIFRESEKHYVTLWFEGRYCSGTAIVNAPYEASDVQWFAWDSFPSPLFLSFRNLLQECNYYA